LVWGFVQRCNTALPWCVYAAEAEHPTIIPMPFAQQVVFRLTLMVARCPGYSRTFPLSFFLGENVDFIR
jgi:hypothetical protein